MANFDEIGLSEPSTITKKLAAISIDRNSTTQFQEVMSIGSPNSTTKLAVAEVLGTAPQSTVVGLAVRVVSGPSTATDLAVRALLPSTVGDNRVTVYQSTAGDLNVTVAGYVAPSTLITIRQSTAADLNVTVAGYSTTVNISSLAGPVIVRSSAADALVSVYQSTAADLNVTVAGYSTTVAVSSIAGPVTIRSSAANALVTAYQSTATDLSAQVQPISGSTWRTQPGSTAWASSAGFHFDSSGALQVTGASASTVVTVARIVGNSSAADAVPVRIVLADGSTYVSPAIDYTHGSTLTASTVTGPAVMLRASSTIPPAVSTSDMFVTQWATLNGAAYSAIVTDSGVSIMDSTNRALNVNVVAGAAGGSTIMTISTVQGAVTVRSSAANLLATVYQSTATDLLARVNQGVGNSTAADRWRVMVANSSAADFIGVQLVDSSGTGFYGPTKPLNVTVTDSSNAVVKPGDSDNNAIRVNVVAGAAAGSTLVTVRQSTYTDFNTLSRIADRDQSTQVANIANTTPASTAYGLVVREAEHSTGPFAISSIAGPVTVRSSAANALVSVYQSTAADLNVTVDGYSTTVNVSSGVIRAQNYTSSGGAIEGSTGTPAAGVMGLHVRQVYPTMNSTTVVITSTHSTAIYEVISSAAGLRHKVYAYFVGSTHTVGSTLIFCSSASGSGFDHWAVNFGSGSSGITGANLALSPPGYIFAGVAQNALNVKVEGGSSAASTVIVRIALSWFDEA